MSFVVREITKRADGGEIVKYGPHKAILKKQGDDGQELMLLMHADKDYVIQSGLETNFSKSLLAGLLELPAEALQEPLTLIVEDNAGGRGRPTVFVRLEWRGQRMAPAFNRSALFEELLARAQQKFGLGSPFGAAE